MALEPDKLSLLVASATYQNMLNMIDSERHGRTEMLEKVRCWGGTVCSGSRGSQGMVGGDAGALKICMLMPFMRPIVML